MAYYPAISLSDRSNPVRRSLSFRNPGVTNVKHKWPICPTVEHLLFELALNRTLGV
jgi:hypothetical protein